MAFNFETAGVSSNWAIGAPVGGEDSDGDGSGDRCDLCQGDDTSGDLDMDGICNDIDPEYVTPCNGTNITIADIQYMDRTIVRASQNISTGHNEVVVLPSADISYFAQQSVSLESGFQTQLGGLFQVYIDDCADLAAAIAKQSVEDETKEDAIRIDVNRGSGQTKISFDLAQASSVSLEIYDANGRKVAQPFHQSPKQAGTHTAVMQSAEIPDGELVVLLRTNQGIQYQRFSRSRDIDIERK